MPDADTVLPKARPIRLESSALWAGDRTLDRFTDMARRGRVPWGEVSSREISTGSTFSGQQGVTIVGREGDITVTGSVLHSEQGAIGLRAKKDVILDSATERESQNSVERSNSKGFLSKSSSLTVTNDRSIRERGALLSGERVTVTAGNDLTVKGSALAADRDISLQAGNNVDIIAATESETHFLLEEKKKSGLLGSGGIGFTLGSQSSRHQVDEKGTTQSLSVSTVGSSQGNVSITAGSSFNPAVSSAQQARNESDSRLAALQPVREIVAIVYKQMSTEIAALDKKNSLSDKSILK
ncbi:hemagglutinin repeat-containing protein [Sodalis praecaptivus]|uniref:hemagglutinin repeat-containing protein n=1 Tax=Sodalis TaxID=84565 RepID=UPI00046CA4BE|nr:hemagglutinin repeat-containing protein [Sodalis praecaptivus]